MAEQIALIEVPVYETTGAEVPRVLHELVAFEILGSPCRVRTGADGDVMFLRFGQRDFALSLLDLAATAALAVEGHLKGEIRSKILGRRQPAPGASPSPVRGVEVVPLRGVVEGNGVVTHFPRRG